MSVRETVLASQFTLMLNKVLPQRPEHLIAAMHYEPRYYKYIFVHAHKFERIPSHFDEVMFWIERAGKDLNGTKYGIYALTPHGRGLKYGLVGKDCRYKAGCIVEFSENKGLKPVEVKFNHVVFNKLLASIKDINRRMGVA